MENLLMQMESSDSIQVSSNTTITTSIGWLCNINIKETYDTFIKFIINAPNPRKNKNWISSTNVIQMDTYPKFGMYSKIDDTSESLESNGCTLVLTSEWYIDTLLHTFSSNDLHEPDDLCLFQGGRQTPRQRRFRGITSTRFVIVTPHFFERNKIALKKEYWSRIVVCGMENVTLLQKLTSTHFRHDFLWIINPLIDFNWVENSRLGSRNFHHGFGINKVPTWFKQFIDKGIWKHVLVYNPEHVALWKPELVRTIRFNTYESDKSIRFHVNNTDYDHALMCVHHNIIDSFDSEAKEEEEVLECGVCLENLSDLTVKTKTSCNHYFCKKCISQWFIRNYQCPTCRSDEPVMSFMKNYEPTNKTNYSLIHALQRYYSITNSTLQNSIIMYRADYHEGRDYFTTNFHKYELNGSYDVLLSTRIKRVFLLDIPIDQNGLLTFFKVNFPHIEEYVIFDYKPFDNLKDSL